MKIPRVNMFIAIFYYSIYQIQKQVSATYSYQLSTLTLSGMECNPVTNGSIIGFSFLWIGPFYAENICQFELFNAFSKMTQVRYLFN